MTTQLQNQDPFAPMENAEFIARWHNSLRDWDYRNGTDLKGLSKQLSEFRIATATNMLGNSVLVPGTKTIRIAKGRYMGLSICPLRQAKPMSSLNPCRVKFCT